ncbi:MAG: hypothetical protein ABI682_12955 [Acidobacteriota bacterium]
MFHLRPASLLLALAALLIATTAPAQGEKAPRTVRLDEGITIPIAPLWQYRQLAPSGATKLELTIADATSLRMAVYITVEKRRNASDALQRAADILGPPGPEDRHFLVNGWPAIEATRMIDVPTMSREPDEKAEKEKTGQQSREFRQEPKAAKFERTMTAIAAADRTVIIEQRLYDMADARLREAGRELVNGLTFTRGGNEGISKVSLDDIDYVRKNLYDRSSYVDYVGNNFGFLTEVKTTNPVLAQNGVGEIAMAASSNGVKVAIISNSGWAKSSDSGATYTGGNFFPSSIANQGDPALAYGGKTDNFYFGYLGRPNGGGGTGNTVNGCTVSVDRSKDGQNYAFAGHVTFCAASSTVTANPPTLMCAPDQEHIAADPVRTLVRGVRPGTPAPKDQVYVAWRQFTAVATAAVNTCAKLGTGNTVATLSCSQDNGGTWTAPLILGPGSDRARVAVGPDGFVYVAYSVQQADPAGGTWNQIYLDKYSSCKTGFVHQWGYPRTVVANARPQSCGATTPGLDRCSGDLMNSHTVTVSDFDPHGMVFVVYSDGTSGVTATNKGTDRVIAAILPNGGFNVTSTHLLSDNTPGRKFLPWACAEGKNLYATWYDRRSATAAAGDLTDYYAGWLKLDKYGPTVHNNINLTGNADAQCKSGWPFGTDNQASGQSCPTPVRPGVCLNNTTGNFTGLCDLSGTPACAAGSTCQTGGGAPKYGDYNANACAAGRLYAAWTSATTPAGAPAAPAGLNTFTRTVQPRVP